MLTQLLAQSDTTLYYTTTSVNQTDTGGLLIFSGIWMLFWLVVAVVAVVAMWKIFVKAGRPGWAAIVPFYNTYVLIQIAGRPGWWVVLYFIPIVNIVISLLVAIDLAKAFGKTEVFGVIALWLFSLIGYLMLGFGKDTYHGAKPVAAPSAPAAPTTPPAAPTVQ